MLKPILILTLIMTTAQTLAEQTVVKPNNLCKANEEVLFSCQVKQHLKIVSLCTSSDFDKTAGYIQYRFGVKGDIELEYPRTQQKTQQNFRLHWYPHRGGLSFKKGGYRYEVMGPGAIQEEPGVRINYPNGDTNFIECKIIEKFFFPEDLKGIIPNADEVPLS